MTMTPQPNEDDGDQKLYEDVRTLVLTYNDVIKTYDAELFGISVLGRLAKALGIEPKEQDQ
jgi:hypothetical protein